MQNLALGIVGDLSERFVGTPARKSVVAGAEAHEVIVKKTMKMR
jgi:hypothetical protein